MPWVFALTFCLNKSQPKIKCEPCALTHGDEVKMGETVLSFHIHSGTDTCDGCEPGQVMAHLSKHKRAVTPGKTPASGLQLSSYLLLLHTALHP